jgi:cell wall-associated NlpC family hydrolase
MTHWAIPLIGIPHRDGGQGPDAFDCWGLTREALRRGWSVAMPPVSVRTEDDQVAALRIATRGWRLIENTPAHGDVVLMANAEGRHVGVMVDGRLLHCGRQGVAWERLADMRLRFWNLEVWRRDA